MIWQISVIEGGKLPPSGMGNLPSHLARMLEGLTRQTAPLADSVFKVSNIEGKLCLSKTKGGNHVSLVIPINKHK